MEREIADLKQRVQTLQASSSVTTPYISAQDGFGGFQTEEDQYMGSHQAVASLLDLRGGSPSGMKLISLGVVILAPDRVHELFQEYFQHYHGWLPFLDSHQTPEQYLKESRLLFWTVISVAARKSDPATYEKLTTPLSNLLWDQIRKVPQDHHVVKALCLLCTWPLPTSKTSTDQTFMLCGLMMQIALQIGLHQPTHPEDFSRYRLQLHKEDINDRIRTWAVCNIVAQS